MPDNDKNIIITHEDDAVVKPADLNNCDHDQPQPKNVRAMDFRGIQYFVRNKRTNKLYGVLQTVDIRLILVDMVTGDISFNYVGDFCYSFATADGNCALKTKATRA